MFESQPRPLKIYFVLWIVLGFVGLISFITLFDTAFPTASIDISMSKEEVEARAVKFAKFLSYKKEDAVIATTFGSDNGAKTFLDYKLGGKRANQLMVKEIPVWRWKTRICKPFSTEEAYIYSWTDGTVQSFWHEIAKEKKIPSISHDEAKKIVLAYAKENTRLNLENWKLIEDKEDRKVNRLDHIFVFEDQSKEYEEARLRAKFRAYGNYVGSFSEYLHVPEDFERHYGKLRATNKLLRTIAGSLGYVLDGSVFFVFIWAIVKRRVRWKFVKNVFVVSAIVFSLFLVNIFPKLVYSYDTARAFSDYMLGNVGMALLTVGAGSFYFALLAASAEALYRKWAPDSIALENLFSSKGFRQKATLVGLSFAFLYLAFSLGYQCLFYFIGQKFGVWCPLGVRDEAAFGMLFPPFYAMFVGYFASISEEIVYRVVGIALFTKLFRNVWIANLVQAVLWGFAHSHYPQQPAYTRGIELSIEGFISGAFFIQFGLLPSLLSHYMFNVTVSSVPSFCSTSILSKLGSLIPYIPPILWLAFVVIQIRRKGLEKPESSGLLNKDIVPSPKPEVVVDKSIILEQDVGKPSKRNVLVVICASIILLSSSYFLKDKSQEIGLKERQSLSKQEIIDKSRAILEDRGIILSGYRVVTSGFSPAFRDEQEIQYLFENAGFEKTNKFVKQIVPTVAWTARWYKPQTPQEYSVTLTAKGELRAVEIKLHENDKATSLTEEQAKETARKFLSKHHKELKDFKFSSIKKEKKKNRTDYSVVFEMPDYKVNEAPLLVTVGIVGAQVADFYTGWQVPSKWTLEKDKKPLWKVILGMYGGLLLTIAVVLAIVVAIDLIAKQGISRNLILWTVVLGASFTLLSEINEWPGLYRYYSTETPLISFESRQAFNILYAIFQVSVSFAILSCVSYACIKSIFQDNWKNYLLQFVPKRFATVGSAGEGRSLWMEAAGASIIWFVLFGSYSYLTKVVIDSMSPTVQLRGLTSFSFIEEFSKSISTIESCLSMTITIGLSIPIAIYIYKRYVKTLRRFLILLLICLPPIFSSSFFMTDAIIGSVSAVVGLLIVFFIATRILQNNLLVVVIPATSGYLLGQAYVLWKYVYPNLQLDFYVLIALGLIPVLIAIDDYFYKPKGETRKS